MSKNWLITGSSQGLGRRLAEVVLGRGGRVVAASRRPELLDDLGRQHGDRLLSVALDVTDAEAARAVVAAGVQRFGSLDVVVNNAGYATTASAEEFPEDEFRAQIEANFFGAVNVTKAALPVLRRQRSGHIVQISSVGGRVGGTPGLSAYQAAKFALAGYSEALANEVAPLGIKVTIVEPGGIRTGWAAGASNAAATVGPDYQETVGERLRWIAGYVGNELGDPVRMAEVIADVTEAGDPPRRLLLGSDAVDITLRVEADRTAETEKWAEISRSTDFTPTA
ncbi:SDR family NAD(P)-dependent oxidoreductase [Sphaerisporangium aureirubrum]|uniref:SDR family NAD(P)-dependent oxidoreductase n=1 Tax=Sphaerisporangium aureirubrum TaxID=1544736 RepID=A0ABW1NGP0_9ACTN